jgi:hypothetical protein
MARRKHDGKSGQTGADALSVMRLVFMNRWVELEEVDGSSYLEDFLVKLREAIEEWAA